MTDGVRLPLRRQLAGCLLVLALFSTVPCAHAHRGHAVWTDIVWAGEGFEITHRLHLADAVRIHRVLLEGAEPVETPRSLARLALYVEARFRVRGVAGEAQTLQTLGAEIEDDFLFVYQQWSTPLPTRFPEVDNGVLIDAEPEAQQFIRITGPGLDEERQAVGRARERLKP